MLTENRKYAIEKLLDGANTNSNGDLVVQAEVLRIYKFDPESYKYVQKLIMEKRSNWLIYYTRNQHNWQCTRSINHFHDSFELREKYIAPHPQWPDDSKYEKRQREFNRKRRPELFIGRK